MYSYKTQKPHLFTEEGQTLFLAIRDKTKELLEIAGACRCDAMINVDLGGDSWDMLACIDRMVELGEIRELTPKATVGQHRVFISNE